MALGGLFYGLFYRRSLYRVCAVGPTIYWAMLRAAVGPCRRQLRIRTPVAGRRGRHPSYRRRPRASEGGGGRGQSWSVHAAYADRTGRGGAGRGAVGGAARLQGKRSGRRRGAPSWGGGRLYRLGRWPQLRGKDGMAAG